jgi:hypothetical protein
MQVDSKHSTLLSFSVPPNALESNCHFGTGTNQAIANKIQHKLSPKIFPHMTPFPVNPQSPNLCYLNNALRTLVTTAAFSL